MIFVISFTVLFLRYFLCFLLHFSIALFLFFMLLPPYSMPRFMFHIVSERRHLYSIKEFDMYFFSHSKFHTEQLLQEIYDCQFLLMRRVLNASECQTKWQNSNFFHSLSNFNLKFRAKIFYLLKKKNGNFFQLNLSFIKSEFSSLKRIKCSVQQLISILN